MPIAGPAAVVGGQAGRALAGVDEPGEEAELEYQPGQQGPHGEPVPLFGGHGKFHQWVWPGGRSGGGWLLPLEKLRIVTPQRADSRGYGGGVGGGPGPVAAFPSGPN